MSADESKHWDDEKLEREEGVLTPGIAGTSAGCDQDSDDCAPDEVVEDPIDDKNVPGTADDLPYDYGVETPAPADQALEAIDHPSKTTWSGGAMGPAEESEAEDPLPDAPDGTSATGTG